MKVPALALALGSACAAPDAPSATVTGAVVAGSSGSSLAANVEVVFHDAHGEQTIKTDPEGKFKLVLPAGAYRVFVRDDAVMSTGRGDRVRLAGLPAGAVAGTLDEALAPTLVVRDDIDGIELPVVRASVLTGTVSNVGGRVISGAIISAHGNNLPRPVLGTDIAISRADGSFELRLPDGEYVLAAQHADYADSVDVGRVELVRGGSRHVSLTMVRGCVVTGKVVGPDGKPAAEGAIEKQTGSTDLDFQPTGRILSDGKFRWTTTDEAEVVLRAWPWHAAPAPAKRFNCRDGARFTHTFTAPSQAADLEGTLVDHDGAPVAFTHLDVQPLEPGGIAQQERTDELGRWAVFQLPPGRYSITAQARGGVVSAPVASPNTNQALKLSGVGRITGTTTQLAHGAFEVSFGACLDGNTVQLPHDRRIVAVTNNRFSIDDAPACDLQLDVMWRGETTSVRAVVPAGGAARIQLDIGAPRDKTVTGVVRDRNGKAVGRANVTATYKKLTAKVITDENGRFTIATVAGAALTVDHDGERGDTTVGLANVARERVEIVVSRR